MMEPQKYETVREERASLDRDDSSTEVDESLLGDEKPWHRDDAPLRTRRRTFWTRIASFRWVLDTTLLLIILGFVAREQMRPTQQVTMDYGGDFTGVGPRIPMKVKKFKSDPSYAPMNTSEFFTPEMLDKWNKLMPIGMGFVLVNDTNKYHDMPTPIHGYPGQTVFTTSAIHQLHCLYTIVSVYSGIKANRKLDDDHHWHMIHCFDYMREAIMCSSDMALEGLETTFPDHSGGSDGWDSTHMCRDYDLVKDYLYSVRARDDQEIF